MNEYWGNFFEWKCPYTDKHCDSFECNYCEVQKQELDDLEAMEDDQ